MTHALARVHHLGWEKEVEGSGGSFYRKEDWSLWECQVKASGKGVQARGQARPDQGGPKGGRTCSFDTAGHMGQHPRESKSRAWPPGSGSGLCPLKGHLPETPGLGGRGWEAGGVHL